MELASRVHLSGPELGQAGYTNTRHAGGWGTRLSLSSLYKASKNKRANFCLLLQLLIYVNQMHANPKSLAISGLGRMEAAEERMK